MDLPFLLLLIVVAIGSFILVIYFLKRVIMKDTESSVNRLEQSYEDVKKKKEELAQKLLEIENEYNKRKEEAEKIAVEIKDKAQLAADEVRAEAFKKAKAEAEDIISKAQKTVDKIKDNIEKDLESKTIDFCGEILNKVLVDVSRGALHEVLVAEFISELEKTDLGKISIESEAATVLTVRGLKEENKQKIAEIIKGKLKKSVTLSEQIDEKLIGGIVLKFGSLTLDASLAARIRDVSLGRKKAIEDRVK